MEVGMDASDRAKARDGARRRATTALVAAVALAAAALAVVPGAEAATQGRFTIVSIGDSFGSGEGNPMVGGQHDADGKLIGRPEQWGPAADRDAQRCHRSPRAHVGQAVELLRRRFPGIQFDFIHLACSGASITRGLLGAYEGVEPSGGVVLDPQLRQVNAALEAAGLPRADALVVNVGVNDIGFGDLVTDCVMFTLIDCSSMDDRVTFTQARLAALSDLFDRLQGAIVGRRGARSPLRAVPGRTYLVEYPDPTQDDDGNLCHLRPQGDLLGRVSRAEAGWVAEEILPELNGRLREAVDNARAGGLAWEYVGGNVEDFQQHGYCARERFLNTNTDALRSQGRDAPALVPASTGIVHPNDAGHASVARRVADAIARQVLAEHPVGTPTLAVADARARGLGRAPYVRLVWSAPTVRAIARFELAIFRADRLRRPLRPVRTVRLPGNRFGYTHSVDGSGAFLYRIRACAPAGDCSPFSATVRASNVAPAELAAPRNLRRDRIRGPLANRVIAMRWEHGDQRWSYYRLEYRRVQGHATLPAGGLTLGDQRAVLKARQEMGLRAQQLSGPVANALAPRLSADPFAFVRVVGDVGTIGSLLHPLSPSDSYEVRLRPCSDVGCGAPISVGVEPVTRPSAEVGEFELDRALRPVPAPGTFALDVRGTLNRPSSLLGAVTIGLRGRDGLLAQVTYDHRRGRLTLQTPAAPGDRDNGGGDDERARRARASARRLKQVAGVLGARRVLRSDAFAVDLRRSRVVARGRQLRVRLVVALPARLKGSRVSVEVSATDRRGLRQRPAVAGALLVRR